MSGRREKILEACLEEVLGNRTPPDLTARILGAWEAQRGLPEAPPVQQGGAEPPAPKELVVPPPQVIRDPEWVSPASKSSTSSRSSSRTPDANPWISVALVGLVLLAGTTLGLVGLNYSAPGASRDVAGAGDKKLATSESVADKAASGRAGTARNGMASTRRERASRANGSSAESPLAAGGTNSNNPRRNSADASASPGGSELPFPRVVAGNSPTVPVADGAVLTLINRSIEQEWRTAKIESAERATEAEWCRRAYLRILGRIPTVEELQRFEDDRTTDLGVRQAALVDRLLGDEYADEYAAYWASYWVNTLLGRGNLDANLAARRAGLAEYFQEALRSNRALDQVATELIAATGSDQRTESDYNSAVNFLASFANSNGLAAAGQVSRVFLGARLQCAECHEHPTGAWTQDHLWQMASFFRQMKVEKLGNQGGVRLANVDFRGEGKDPSEAVSYYELRNGQLKAAFPVFLDGQAGSRSGLMAEADRRRELATFVRQSPQFAQTTVNRLWAHFLGFGFTHPVDDAGSHNPPSHPELLEHLGADFAGQGFDVKRLIRWIVLSEPFGLSSKSGAGNLADAPESGSRPMFARYYARPMQAEELSKSLQMLAEARGSAGTGTADQARVAWLQQLGRALPTEDDARGIRQPIAPSLIMTQRDLAARATAGQAGSLIAKVAENRSMSVDAKIEHLFQAALARKPAAAELKSARKLLEQSPSDLAQGLSDVWWVLLNSSEFALDH